MPELDGGGGQSIPALKMMILLAENALVSQKVVQGYVFSGTPCG
jgi:hypothetical protein